MAEEVTLIFGIFAIFIPIILIVASFIVLFVGKYFDKKAHGNLILPGEDGMGLIFKKLLK